MLSADFVIATGVAYVGLLFLIAYVGDRRARAGKGGFLRSPVIYTLAISVYCTSWTFYGAVGSAARNGLEYLAIYLGPTLVFIGWWFLLRRLVRISHNQRITSVADLLSSRFGKSSRLAVLITIIAVIGIAPYIALQLKAVTSSIQAIAGARAFERGSLGGIDDVGLAFGVAAGMALFTILFGTRNVDAKEQHHGVVAAIAFEAVVKLAALLAVGIFVVYAGGGFEPIFSRAAEAGIDIYSTQNFDARWVAMNVLSVAAIICLPRQFQVGVVECAEPADVRRARWAFPAYLALFTVLVVPVVTLAAQLGGAPPGGADMLLPSLPMANSAMSHPVGSKCSIFWTLYILPVSPNSISSPWLRAEASTASSAICCAVASVTPLAASSAARSATPCASEAGKVLPNIALSVLTPAACRSTSPANPCVTSALRRNHRLSCRSRSITSA